ncbi:hypothetical protein [Ensifer sp. 4252]|uniref:hypothetical protein n=1 Tax=Ensifer sp. 4252 TaxID=3373915 RepID=UPI003D259387
MAALFGPRCGVRLAGEAFGKRLALDLGTAASMSATVGRSGVVIGGRLEIAANVEIKRPLFVHRTHEVFVERSFERQTPAERRPAPQ